MAGIAYCLVWLSASGSGSLRSPPIVSPLVNRDVDRCRAKLRRGRDDPGALVGAAPVDGRERLRIARRLAEKPAKTLAICRCRRSNSPSRSMLKKRSLMAGSLKPGPSHQDEPDHALQFACLWETPSDKQIETRSANRDCLSDA
ncbi:hypothetical protein BUPH_08331 (plasmid) [Paraburkholderia phenoliruptrix BR3459a]|uniref:Uncharacterized protein n=1 Tax=Paraburkholderia phenoliruptrix BR3459a TaxID=1229205 RepID=K0DUV8_9BURK|nr:hypothetical protein BUPH_08331 [Paraburkholderia phenoliruptrix BR3459a]